MSLFIGVDVGSCSVRSIVVDEHGKVHSRTTRPIQTWRPEPNHVEQSSADIWTATKDCIRAAVETIEAANVKGIGFDASKYFSTHLYFTLFPHHSSILHM